MATVTDAAREAWEMLSRTENPMPVPAAIDWLRQEMGTDDVKLLKKELYRAAGSAVQGARPDETTWPSFSNRVAIGIENRKPEFFAFVNSIKRWSYERKERKEERRLESLLAWGKWTALANAANNLCRVIESLPE